MKQPGFSRKRRAIVFGGLLSLVAPKKMLGIALRAIQREAGAKTIGRFKFDETKEYKFMSCPIVPGETVHSLVKKLCKAETPAQADRMARDIANRNRGIQNEIRIPVFYLKRHLLDLFEGKYNEYSLDRGNTLYSLALEKTDYETAQDINYLADELAYINSLKGVSEVPAGAKIIFPNSFLSKEELKGMEVRMKRKAAWFAANEKKKTIRRKGKISISQVRVILDAGHGFEKDPGASGNGIKESVVTGRFVGMLDKELKERGIRTQQIPRVSVRKREKIINQRYRVLTRRGVPAEGIIFISIHGDALHREKRGTTIYIPGSYYYNSGRGQQFENEKEGLSRSLAENIGKQLLRNRQALTKQRPYREVIVRGRQKFVPAVIRTDPYYSILIELGNINNPKDALDLGSADVLKRKAQSIASGVVSEITG